MVSPCAAVIAASPPRMRLGSSSSASSPIPRRRATPIPTWSVIQASRARRSAATSRRDPTAADPIETFAREKHVTYVKLDGTNAEEGRQILADAGRENIHPEATMLDGARRAVELAA